MYGVISSPAIGDDGTVYIGSSDKKFYALNGHTGVKQWEFKTKAPVRGSPVIGEDGTIYIGSHDSKNGILYALASSSKGLADSPWPMRGQNPQQTSRAPSSLKDGLVAYYPFNGNATDESGNGNDGEVKGATLSADRHGEINNAYKFSGTDYIDIGKDESLQATTLTLSAWVYSENYGRYSGVVSYLGDYHKPRHGYSMGIRNDALAYVLAGQGMQEHYRNPQTDEAVNTPIGKWHHIVLSCNESVSGYINGNKIWGFPRTKTIEFDDSITCRIGAFCNDSEKHGLLFKGSIDDVRIYNRALSEAEVNELYNLEKPSSETASSSKKPGTVLWEFKTGGEVLSSSAIGSDGTVYIGASDKKVYALGGKTGAKKWELDLARFIADSSVAIGANGDAYVGTTSGELWALKSKTGAKKWIFKSEDSIYSSPAIGVDGTIYFGSKDQNIYALDGETGIKQWEFETGFPVYSSPSIGPDGTIYVGSYDKNIYALDGKTGAKKWGFETGSTVYSSPAIGADGTVYCGSDDRKVYALDDKTGAKKWEFEAAGRVHGSPGIGSDGTIYVGAVGKIYALDGGNGSLKWECTVGGEVISCPAIGTDGTIYIGSTDGKVYALDGQSGTKKWEFETEGMIRSSASIGPDGTVYIGSNDGKVYALATSSKGLADSPWPMFGQNTQHTGRAGTIPNSPEAAAAIEAAIREAANKPTGTLTTVDLEKVKNLHLRAVEISDLTVFSGLVELEKLNLDKNNITDLSPLSNLTKLQEIALQYSKISDLRPLAGMKQLKGISLHNNRVTDISPLAGLTKLEVLTLEGNGVTDISPLTSLTKLKLLTLHYTGVSDVSPLEKLTDMEDLIINNNPVSDITPLASMTKLRRLAASSNGFADLTPLAGLKGLDDLDISKNKISNLKPLAGLTNLKALYLADNSITDISSLAELKKLEILNLSNNPAITRAQIAVLQKALPDCKITHNAGPTIGTEIGSIASFDPKFSFYVVDRGADHGIKKGDEFSVFRAGKFVGKIRIKQVQPTVSIAEAIKDLTPQKLQAGDKVGKMN